MFDKKILQTSFGTIQTQKEKFLNQFFSLLLADFPALRPYFESVDMELQKTEFNRAVIFIIRNLEHEDKLKAFLLGLGEVHASFGIKSVHYSWLSQTLIKCLGETLKEEFIDSVKKEWEHLINFIGETMIQGARQSTPSKVDMESLPGGNSSEEEESAEEPKSAMPLAQPEALRGEEEESQEEKKQEIKPEAKQEIKPEDKPENKDQNPAKIDEKLISKEIKIPESMRQEIRNVIKQSIEKAILEEAQKILAEELSSIDLTRIETIFKKAG